jgi:hypothetical protein
LTRRRLFSLVAGLLTAAVSPFRHHLCLAEIDDLQTRVMLNDLEIDKSLQTLNGRLEALIKTLKNLHSD